MTTGWLQTRMHKSLTIAIVVLAAFAFCVLCASLYGQYALWVTPGVLDSQRFALLPGIAVSIGVLIAALTFVRERGKAETEQRRHVAEILLAQASDGFKAVVALLSDQNNNRAVWVQAARTLLQARRLGALINSAEYKIAYNLQEERARNELYHVLTLSDENSSARKPLPPQFFYGIDDWRNCDSLEDAAARTSPNPIAYQVTIDTVRPQPVLRPLAERSVAAIFDFAAFPSDYDDPLDEAPEWDENWDLAHGMDEGARRYVAHRIKNR